MPEGFICVLFKKQRHSAMLWRIHWRRDKPGFQVWLQLYLTNIFEICHVQCNALNSMQCEGGENEASRWIIDPNCWVQLIQFRCWDHSHWPHTVSLSSACSASPATLSSFYTFRFGGLGLKGSSPLILCNYPGNVKSSAVIFCIAHMTVCLDYLLAPYMFVFLRSLSGFTLLGMVLDKHKIWIKILSPIPFLLHVSNTLIIKDICRKAYCLYLKKGLWTQELMTT